MKYFIIFVLFAIGCSEEHEIKTVCSPFRMTISDAIPIQFWVNGVETYNQKEVCGITPACFCQPFNCDDEIRIQVQTNTQQRLELVILDSGGIEIDRLEFSEIAVGVYQMSFVPSEIDICDEKVRFVIENDALSIISTANLSGYSNGGSGTNDWDLNDNPVSVSLPISGNGLRSSKHLLKSVSPFSAGETLSIHSIVLYFGTVANAGTTYQLTVNIVFLDVSFTVVGSSTGILGQPITGMAGGFSGSNDETNNIVIPAGTVYIGIQGTVNTSGYVAPGSVLFELSTFDVPYYEEATSDCIDIQESHDCTALIRYVNSKDFADIEYSDFSPNSEFYLRVPAVFFHETNPSEEERFETSDQTIVRLRDEVKVKKNLEVGYMPDYMHRKLILVLAHDTVEIDGDTWVRTDPYEKVPPANKRYPLKMANVLLTLQGYIKRNIL